MSCRAAIGFVLTILLLCSAARADNFDQQYAEARKLLDAGKTREAAAIYIPLKASLTEALDKSPNDAHLNFLLGKVAMDGGDDEAAGASLDKALGLDPKNIACLTARATLLEYQEKPDEAARLLSRAADLAPNDPDSWISLARAQEAAHHYPDALASINKAVVLKPKEPRYLGMIAEVLVAQGKPDEAMKVYRQAVTLDPNYLLGQLNIGQLNQDQGKFNDALDAYANAVKIDPQNLAALSKQVQLYEAMKKPAERDAARDKVFAIWKAGKTDQKFYCREQFAHANEKVMVFEYFELAGEDRIRYSFMILNPQGEAIKRISLGSDDPTTQIARELGDIAKDQRLFTLDEEDQQHHATLGTFKKEPTYEETRQMVSDYLDGKLDTKAATTFPPPAGKKP